MKNTKTLILQSALRLFNEKGLTDTTLRNIAADMGISQGNLNYHFKRKEEIIIALYFELVRKMDERMSELDQNLSNLYLFYESSRLAMMQMYDYRFLLTNFLKIMNEVPEVKKHYLELQQLRKHQFVQIFHQLAEHRIMRKETFQDEYSRLYERMNILGDYWINAYGISGSNEKNIQYYVNLLFETIYPYLSFDGQEEYMEILNKTAVAK